MDMEMEMELKYSQNDQKISIDFIQSRHTIFSFYHLEIYGEQMSFGLNVMHTDHFNW